MIASVRRCHFRKQSGIGIAYNTSALGEYTSTLARQYLSRAQSTAAYAAQLSIAGVR
jgi:hypothetical protein